MKVGNLVFGEGKPKVCIPIVGTTREEIVRLVIQLQELTYDLVELRIDYYERVESVDEVIELLKQIKKELDKPILFTLRTKDEGGEYAISIEEYLSLYEEVIASNLVEMIDVEMNLGDEVVRSLCKKASNFGVALIVSNHEFHHTPSVEEMVRRLVHMQELGASVPKLAVMPTEKQDVLNLIEATMRMNDEYNTTPIITMSMSELGMVTRVLGEFSGSAMTFATNGQASAPGQIPVGELNGVLDTIHKYGEK